MKKKELIEIIAKQSRKTLNIERNVDIFIDKINGESYNSLVRKYGISTARLQSIVASISGKLKGKI